MRDGPTAYVQKVGTKSTIEFLIGNNVGKPQILLSFSHSISTKRETSPKKNNPSTSIINLKMEF